jgi:hypothetical protein
MHDAKIFFLYQQKFHIHYHYQIILSSKQTQIIPILTKLLLILHNFFM